MLGKIIMQKRYVVKLVFSCVLYFIASLLSVVEARLLGKIIDAAIEVAFSEMIKNIIISCGVIILNCGVLLTAEKLQYRFVNRSVYTLRNFIQKSLLQTPISMFSRNDDSYYINLLTGDIDILQRDYYHNLPLLCFFISQVVLYTIALWNINWLLLIVGIVLTGLPILVAHLFSKMTQRSKAALSKANEAYLFEVKESVQGFTTIKHNNCANDYLEKFNKRNLMQQNMSEKDQMNHSISYNVSQIVVKIGYMAIIAFGGYLILNNKITVGLLITATNMASQIMWGGNNFIELALKSKSTKVLHEKINTVLLENVISEDIIRQECIPDINFRDVSFGFGEKTLFANFSFCFCNKQCYAILGESGSGKSTLLRLLLKHYDAYEGKILIGDKDIRDLSEASIYSLIAVVDQAPYLFNATIHQNITLFNESIGQLSSEYQNAISQANIQDLCAQKGETLIGDFGNALSGGERQRISLARALLRNPQIIIFDEPTTGLDPENARNIMDMIFSLKQATRIVISHDWSEGNLARFDDIIHLEQYKCENS